MRFLFIVPLLLVLGLIAWLMFSLPGPAVLRVAGRVFLLVGVAAMLGMFVLRGHEVLPHWVSVALCLLSTVIYFLLILQFVRAVLLLPGGLLALIWKTPWQVLVSGQLSLAILLVGIALGALGFWNAIKLPEVREVRVDIPDLPPELEGFRLVQLTDLHVGTIYDQNWLREVVNRANALRPDLIAVTGDTGEYAPGDIQNVLSPLFDLRAAHGVFYSLGNHEYYQDLDGWIAWYERAGIFLRNSHKIVEYNGAKLAVAGLDDVDPDFEAAYAGLPADIPRVLLAHQPSRAMGAAANGTNLMLSGHTHGGMLPGLRQVVARANRGFVGGMYHVDDMTLYVSNGTGLWTYMAMRLLTPAEITVLQLFREN